MDTRKPLAIVTGSSRGIGKGIALRLARAGYRLALIHFEDAEAAEDTVKEIRELGSAVQAWNCDLANCDGIPALFLEISQALGGPSLLVNNAGITPKTAFLEATPELWQQTLSINLVAPALCARAVLPSMMDHGRGRIINIASTHAVRTAPPFSVYAATKGGLQSLTRALATEFGPHGITCNCLLVGAILTERTRENYTPDRQEIWKKFIPVGRWGTPEEIGDAVVFLARNETNFINGASLEIDGGVLAAIPQVGDFL